jgi:hypothetical protein
MAHRITQSRRARAGHVGGMKQDAIRISVHSDSYGVSEAVDYGYDLIMVREAHREGS